uniref:Peroxisomal adenine nucleotide transporter 1 n=1 Tax=Syphacia muris TaxID=451379 RepID=A0A0N5AQA1_9BILA
MLISAAVQLIPGIPIELIKTKLKEQHKPQSYNWKAVARNQFQRSAEAKRVTEVGLSVYKEYGIRGFYKVLAEGIAGSLSWIAICPFELVKTCHGPESNQHLTNCDQRPNEFLQTKVFAAFTKAALH